MTQNHNVHNPGRTTRQYLNEAVCSIWWKDLPTRFRRRVVIRMLLLMQQTMDPMPLHYIIIPMISRASSIIMTKRMSITLRNTITLHYIQLHSMTFDQIIFICVTSRQHMKTDELPFHYNKPLYILVHNSSEWSYIYLYISNDPSIRHGSTRSQSHKALLWKVELAPQSSGSSILESSINLQQLTNDTYYGEHKF